MIQALRLFFIFFFVSTPVVALNYSECQTILAEIFNQPVNQKKLQYYMKLQGKLTLHKLTWSIYANDVNRPRLSLEAKIISTLNLIQKEGNNDPEFLSIKKMFEKNTLSRKSLARVMPHINQVLIKQAIEINDSYDRKHFILNKNDMKLLAILGEKEKTLETGLYDSFFTKDKPKDQGILNYAKIINSSMRNKKITRKNIDKIADVIEKIQKSIKKLIGSLEIPIECQIIMLNSCRDDSDQKHFSDIFLKIANQHMKEDRHKNLRYDSIWLHYKKYQEEKSKKIKKNQVKIKKVHKKKNKEAQNKTENKTKKINGVKKKEKVKRNGKEGGKEKRRVELKEFREKPLGPALTNHLIDKVIERYHYFFTKDWLKNNKDFTYELARAMDEKRNWVIYKNKKYQIPDTFNYDAYIQRGFSKSDHHNNEIIKMNKSKDYSTQSHCLNKKRHLPNLYHALNGVLDYNLKEKKNVLSFRYLTHLCDGKTGKIIARNINGFLSYPLSDISEKDRPTRRPSSPEEDFLISKALNSEKEHYIYRGKLYSLSGVEKKAKLPYLHILKNRPEVVQAAVEESSYALIDDQLIDMKEQKILSSKEVDRRLSSIVSFGEAPSPIKLKTSSDGLKGLWLKSISDGEYHFSYNEKLYSTLDGNEYKPLRPIEDGNRLFINEDEYYKEIRPINKLTNHEVIKHYQKNFSKNKCSHYTVLDKNKSQLLVYSQAGDIIFKKEVLIGEKEGDQRTMWTSYNPDERLRVSNYQTGAGIYTTGETKRYKKNFSSEKNNYYKMFEGNILTLEQHHSDSKNTIIALHQIPIGYEDRYGLFNNQSLEDNLSTGGCINAKQEDMVEYLNKFYYTESGKTQNDCDFYILPTEDKHHFQIHNRGLVFKPKSEDLCQKEGCYKWTNYTKKGLTERPENIKIHYDIEKIMRTLPKERRKNRDEVEKSINDFSSSLVNHKSEIMKKTRLSNLEYNQLSRVAIAILGVESEFGTSLRYHFKERLPLLVEAIKKSTNNSSALSQGPSQIKNVNGYYQQYGFQTIDPKSLYKNKKEAAKATMLVLADMLKRLKKYKKENGLVDFSTPNKSRKTINSLIYYLYQGKSLQLEGKLASPKINIQAKKIKEMTDAIDIFIELQQ